MFHHLSHMLGHATVLPIPQLPKKNRIEGGTAKIKVNPTQLSDQMAYPVGSFSASVTLFGHLEQCKTVAKSGLSCCHDNRKGL